MPSDRREISRWLADIRHNIGLEENFTAGFAYDAFKDDTLRLYAEIRYLEIISEASRRRPDISCVGCSRIIYGAPHRG